MDFKRLRDGGRKILVDFASVAIFLVSIYQFLSGFGIVYTAFYQTGKPPTPDGFTSACQSFAAGTSFVYLLLLTRKYRSPEKEPLKEAGR